MEETKEIKKNTKKSTTKKAVSEKKETKPVEKKVAEKKPSVKKEETAVKKTSAKKPKAKVEKVEEVKKVAAKVEDNKTTQELSKEPVAETPIEMPQSSNTKFQELVKDENNNTDNEPILIKEEKKRNIPIVTIILAVITVVLAILLLMNNTKSKVELNTLLPDVFDETPATINLPSGFMIADSGELFEKEDGILVTKGYISGAAYTEEDFNEMKTYYVENYGASEVTLEGFQAINISQTSETDTYNYFFLYKDNLIVQLVTVNCTESQINTLLNSVNY